MFHSIFGCAVLLVVPAILCGCGQKSGVKLVKVTGIVRLDGEPLPGAQLTFVPLVEGGSAAYGQSDGSGKYRLKISRDTFGAMPGKNNVFVELPGAKDAKDLKAHGFAVPPQGVKLSERYTKPGELTAEIPPDGGTVDIELSTK